MSDNISLGGYCGNVALATDDIGNVHYQRTKVNFGSDGDALDVSLANPLPVDVQALSGVVDNNNSTTTPLAAAATFTGVGTDVLGYAAVTVTLHTDQDSAASGMKFQFSMDNVNWDDSYNFNMDVSASATRRFQFPTTARYFRVVFENGGTDQTELRIQTILHKDNQLTSIHRLADDMSPDRSAQVVKTALFGYNDDTLLFKSVAVTPNAELEVVNNANDDGGCGTHRSLDLDETPETVKTGKGNLYWTQGFNQVNADRFVKFYDAVSAGAVTVGTTTPKLTMPLNRQGTFESNITQGLFFSAGIVIACTTGLADNDTGAPGANNVIINVGYG